MYRALSGFIAAASLTLASSANGFSHFAGHNDPCDPGQTWHSLMMPNDTHSNRLEIYRGATALDFRVCRARSRGTVEAPFTRASVDARYRLTATGSEETQSLAYGACWNTNAFSIAIEATKAEVDRGVGTIIEICSIRTRPN